ncbi:hypothetical protein SBOR_8061 [Sclerotinia borealis F-4128]|uniref:Small ribosomal subunit protein bS18m n=1 Tax=Sclerotinia borealis (strain F-4128) TaxID=1432307 RepID=W9CAG4_SCLBF|nr:hypothetical protein SBOR_8061 [Sclerotinia borealis F-4128]
MPPQLRCLNAVRNAISIPSLRMQFSTSRVMCADLPPAFQAETAESMSLSGLQSLVNKVQERNTLKMAERDKALQAKARATPQTDAEENGVYVARSDLTKQMYRRWRAGDIYAPHDLSGTEAAKWKKRGKVTSDVFDVIAFDPIATGSYKNFSIMSEYVTPMGRIKGSRETGLRPVNQRKIARTIRRSVGMGMMPSVHRHPEVLYMARERANLNDNYKRGPMV